MKQIVLAMGLGVGLLSGCSGTDDGSGTAELTAVAQGAITGGELVGQNIEPYSSVVKIWSSGGGCSAVKVGARRFLSAAHCNVLIDPRPTTGARITMTNSLDGLGGTLVTVDRVYPHPSYWVPPAGGLTLTSLSTIYDIAVIDLQNDTPSIPTLPTDSTAFGDGWLGTMVAYGCDARTDIPSTNGGKKQAAEFGSASLAEFQARFVWPGYSHAAGYQHYIVFDGRPRYPGAPTNFFRQICPGDSGGPLFRWNNGWKVAGINSHFWGGAGPVTPVAQFSATTRVASVAGWLAATNKIKGAPRSITNALTGKCLGVAGSTTAGAPVVQELCGDRTPTNSSQYWTKEGTRGGYIRFVNGRSGFCMQASANRIEQHPCDIGNRAQDFLILVGSPSLTPLISQSGAYAGVNGTASPYGSVNVDLGADEATTRMRWIWTN